MGCKYCEYYQSSKKKAEFKVALKDKKQIAKNTYAFVFEKPNKFYFRAGQHIRMTLNPAEIDNKGNSRFFSLTNSPQDTDLVIATRMRDTPFKRALGRMQFGDKALIEILLDNPYGSFTLHDDTTKPAVFLIGGIGVVTAFSMIKDALERKLQHSLFLFYSNRQPEDAPFLEELENLAKQNSSFKFIATMTKPEKSAKIWQGETGFINYSLLKKYVDDPQSPIYYIVGLPEMVSAMQTMLKDAGIKENNIRVEKFSGFKIEPDDNITGQAWKGYIPLVVIVLVIIALVLHAIIAISIYNTGTFSLKNSFSYLAIGLFLVLAMFKLKHLLNFKHRKSNPKKI